MYYFVIKRRKNNNKKNKEVEPRLNFQFRFLIILILFTQEELDFYSPTSMNVHVFSFFLPMSLPSSLPSFLSIILYMNYFLGLIILSYKSPIPDMKELSLYRVENSASVDICDVYFQKVFQRVSFFNLCLSKSNFKFHIALICFLWIVFTSEIDISNISSCLL